MYRELARKQPAQVVKTEPAVLVRAPREAVVRDVYRTVVAQKVHRLYSQGWTEQEYRIGYDKSRRLWTARVTYRARRHSWWWRHWLKLTVSAALMLSAAALLAMVLKVVAMLMVVIVPAAFVFSALWVVIVLVRASGSREVTVCTKVRVRG